MLMLFLIRRYLLLIDTLLLLGLMAYVTLGTENVPFHGDESTTIWMSLDFDRVVLQGDVAAVAYEPPPRRNTEQHLRIITSNVSKMAMGVAWWGAGYSPDEINDQWVWGNDLNWNRDNERIPSERLLLITRLTSAWMTAISVVFVLATARLVGQQLLTNPLAVAAVGWGAAFLYATHPAVLVNGRRAMFEGGLLLGMAMLTWTVLRLRIPYTSWPRYIILGIITGFALSTKHSATFTVVLLYGGLVILALQQADFHYEIGKIGIATLVALLIFLLLNPHWWSRPLQMPAITIEQRQMMLDEQAALYGDYEAFQDRLSGLWDQSLRPAPQYFEAPFWDEYAGVEDEIASYDDSLWAGWSDDIGIFAVRLLLVLAGLWLLVRNRSHLGLIVLLWMLGLLIIMLITVPMAWQRYYLPLQLPLTIVMGLGGGLLIELWFRGQYVEI